MDFRRSDWPRRMPVSNRTIRFIASPSPTPPPSHSATPTILLLSSCFLFVTGMALFGVDLRTTQHHQHHHEVGSLLHDPVIRQLQAQLSEQQQQISQLQTRYDTLVKEAADEAQARRASAAEVVLLKAQLNEFKRLYCSEGSGANVGTISATSNAAPSSSVPFMPSTAGTWSEVGVAGPFNGTLSVNASSNTGLSLSQPPSCPASLDRYAAEIPVDEREAMRTRMLRDRGPHHTPLPLQQQPADTSLPQVEEASRAPSPEADTSRLSLLHDGETPPRYPRFEVDAEAMFSFLQELQRTAVVASPTPESSRGLTGKCTVYRTSNVRRIDTYARADRRYRLLWHPRVCVFWRGDAGRAMRRAGRLQRDGFCGSYCCFGIVRSSTSMLTLYLVYFPYPRLSALQGTLQTKQPHPN